MKNPARVAAPLALTVALCAAIPSTASGVVVRGPGGKRFGVIPHRGISARSLRGSLAAARLAPQGAADDGTLSYHDGPVLHSSAPYLIFWTPGGESIPQSTRSLLSTYLRDTATDSGKADDVFAVTRQYTDGTGFADYQQSFNAANQVIVDSDSYPSNAQTTRPDCPIGSSSPPTCLTDTQLQQEIQHLIGADGLPADGSSTDELPRNAPVYFIALPSDVNICTPPSTQDSSAECADNTFCAYHSLLTDGNNTVLYAAIPTLLAASRPKACQFDGHSAVQEPNGDPGDVVIGDLSHEYSETITDPLVNAWYDDISGNEEGDDCTEYGSADPAQDTNPNAFSPALGGSASAGTLYDQLIDGDQYYTQSEWSNGDTGCEMQPATGTITPSFTQPAGPNAVGTSLAFDPSASTSSNPISSETWNFGDRTPRGFHAGGLATVAHTYAAAGTYTVTLTLVDTSGNLEKTTSKITVYSRPSAAFSFAPSSPREGTAVGFDGTASDPDQGVSVTDYTWDFGDGSQPLGGRSETTPRHTYAKYGTYTVKLTVTNGVGLTTTVAHQVTISDERPSAAFTTGPGPYEVGKAVGFDGGGSHDPDGQITSYSWNFGDGSGAASDAIPSHTYARGGAYTITLTVTDGDLQQSTTSKQITVYPIASFLVATAHPAAKVPVQFNAAGATAPNTSISSYHWSFGDGSSGAGFSTRHTYRKAGTYLVTLSVFDSAGSSDAASAWVVVVPGSQISKVSTKGRGESKTLAISVNGPGKLVVGSRRFIVTRAKTIRVHLGPTRSQRARLRKAHGLTVVVVIRFTPRIGAPTTKRLRITFSG